MDHDQTVNYFLGVRRSAKTVHVASAGCIVVAAAFIVWLFPDLLKDEPTTFATITGFATLYGLIFAIIELLRAKSAASLVSDSTRRAIDRVSVLYDTRSISECQHAIESALDNLESSSAIPLTTLAKITRLYINEVSAEYSNPESTARQQIAIVESYALLCGAGKVPPSKKVQATLLNMMASLSASMATKLTKEPTI